MTVLPTGSRQLLKPRRLDQSPAQPGPGGDVAGPVEVGIQVAVEGADDGVLSGPAASGPAGVAVDRGGGGVHEDDPSSGAFSLGDKDAHELVPAGVQDRPVQPGLGSHVAAGHVDRAPGRGGQVVDVQLLQRYFVIALDESPSGLVVEVAPLVADRTPLLGERPPQPPAVARTGPGTCLSALQIGEPPLSGIQEPRVVDDLAFASCQEPRHPQIDPDRAACSRQRHGLNVGDDDHIPAPALPLELQRLDPTQHLSVLVHLDPPDRLEAGIRPPGVAGRLPPGAVPGHEQHLVEALIRLEPRIASPPPLPLGVADTPEIGGEHDVEAAENLLLGSERMATLPAGIRGADLLELRRLIAVSDPDPLHTPGFAALGEGGVIQVAVVSQQLRRPALLRTREVGTQLVGASHGQPLSGGRR